MKVTHCLTSTLRRSRCSFCRPSSLEQEGAKKSGEGFHGLPSQTSHFNFLWCMKKITKKRKGRKSISLGFWVLWFKAETEEKCDKILLLNTYICSTVPENWKPCLRPWHPEAHASLKAQSVVCADPREVHR